MIIPNIWENKNVPNHQPAIDNDLIARIPMIFHHPWLQIPELTTSAEDDAQSPDLRRIKMDTVRMGLSFTTPELKPESWEMNRDEW